MKSVKLFGIMLIALLSTGCGTMLSINVRPAGVVDEIRRPRTCRVNIIIKDMVMYTPDAIPLRDDCLFVTVETFSYDGWSPSEVILYDNGDEIARFKRAPYGYIRYNNKRDGATHVLTAVAYFKNTDTYLDEYGQLVKDVQEFPHPATFSLPIRHYSKFH